MKLSEQERLMLVEKQGEILKLSNEILENLGDTFDEVYIKTRMNSILSLISTISSYTDTKSYNLGQFRQYSVAVMSYLVKDRNKHIVDNTLTLWCGIVNSIDFKFTEKEALIKLPKLELNLLKNSLTGLKTNFELDDLL